MPVGVSSLASRIITAVEICMDASVAAPAMAATRTRGAMPSGKRNVGRQRTPLFNTAGSWQSARTTTPRVVPTVSTSSASRGRPAAVRPVPASAPYQR